MEIPCSKSRAFTLVEVLATVGLFGILSALSFSALSGVGESSRENKLMSDVATLNRAVIAYQSSGGDLSTSTSVSDILFKLKTVGDGYSQITIPGYRGSFVDARLVTIPADASTTGLRAIWNTDKRFELTHTGPGVEAFEFQDEPTETSGMEERRKVEAVSLATKGGWIWDYDDSPAASASPPSKVTVRDQDLDYLAATSLKRQLMCPIISTPGGSYFSSEFAGLNTHLVNPASNPPSSQIRYSVNGGPWLAYEGEIIPISPDLYLSAYVTDPNDSSYYNSLPVSQKYRRIPGLTGVAKGTFHSASGPRPKTMVTSYAKNGLMAQFEWGHEIAGFDTGSVLEFTGRAFHDVTPENWFQVGSLSYFNSTITSVSEATFVAFDLTLDLDSLDREETFSFNFGLENTKNLGSQTRDENADYVRIEYPDIDFSTALNDKEYQLELRFGYFGSEGFASVDQFHVHEGALAQADMWAYFSEVGEEFDALKEEKWETALSSAWTRDYGWWR